MGKENTVPWFKKTNVGDFFLNEAHPYSKKRTISLLHVLLVLGGLAVVVLVAGSVLEKRAVEERAQAQAAKEAKANTNIPGATPSSAPPNTNKDYLSLQSTFGGRGGGAGGHR